MNRTLVELIAQVAIFLEQADESVLSLDAAVKLQEEMAFRLQRLSPKERSEFLRMIAEIAASNPFDDQRRILLEFPRSIGID